MSVKMLTKKVTKKNVLMCVVAFLIPVSAPQYDVKTGVVNIFKNFDVENIAKTRHKQRALKIDANAAVPNANANSAETTTSSSEPTATVSEGSRAIESSKQAIDSFDLQAELGTILSGSEKDNNAVSLKAYAYEAIAKAIVLYFKDAQAENPTANLLPQIKEAFAELFKLDSFKQNAKSLLEGFYDLALEGGTVVMDGFISAYREANLDFTLDMPSFGVKLQTGASLNLDEDFINEINKVVAKAKDISKIAEQVVEKSKGLSSILCGACS